MKKRIAILLCALMMEFGCSQAMEHHGLCVYRSCKRVGCCDAGFSAAALLALKIKECCQATKNYLTKALEKVELVPTSFPERKEAELEKIALVLDIDETCILTQASCRWLINNGLDEETEIQDNFDSQAIHNFVQDFTNPHPVNNHVLQLARWAKEKGINVYYLSSRPEQLTQKELQQAYPSAVSAFIEQRCSICPYDVKMLDLRPYHRVILELAGYPCSENSLICRNRDSFAKIATSGQWKQGKLRELEERHPVYAFLDDLPDNVNLRKAGQRILPSVNNPGFDV